MERKPEVPASNRDEALFHFVKPSGVPRGPSSQLVFKPSEACPFPRLQGVLEAGKRWASLAQARAASRPGLCAIAPGRRAGAPPLWQLCRVGTGESGIVLSEEGNSACLSRCSGGLRPLVQLCGRRSLVGCSPWGQEDSVTTERLHFHFSLSCIGEGNGNPLQCSCLENPRDRGAWPRQASGVPFLRQDDS